MSGRVQWMGISFWGLRIARSCPSLMVDTSLHTPVLLARTLELLAPALAEPGAVLVDATLGLGGHAEAFLTRFPELVLVGIDRDQEALRLAGFSRATGILFDLGVSSLQLDRVDRGFSYSQDAPLDMRMDATSELTAERILAEYSEYDLRRIFYEYGEEKLAPRYARKIVQAREISPLSRSGQLVDVLIAATPAAVKRAGHPAKRVFQALRIEVNDELGVLARAIPAGIGALAVGGRMVVLAYQSLEDRIVKRAFAAGSTSTAPSGLPVELPEHRPELRLLVRGAELASEDERAVNPRATPVRLRAVERVRDAA
jgi:16S rRNA (cytosine1402-N4)-methyltransferase